MSNNGNVMTIKEEMPNLLDTQRKIDYKNELLADIKAADAKVEKLNNLIKESQEEIKAILEANLDYFTIEQEKKELEKERKAAVKALTKGTSFKPALLVAFLKAKQKKDGVEVVKSKGAVFSHLEAAIA